MKKLNLLLILTLFIGFFSCSNNDETSDVNSTDSNGKYYISKLKAGDMTLFGCDYNQDKLLTKFTIYQTVGYESLKSKEIVKEYTSGKVTKTKAITFATREEHDYIWNDLTQTYKDTIIYKKGDTTSITYSKFEYSGDNISKIYVSNVDNYDNANYIKYEYDGLSGNIIKTSLFDAETKQYISEEIFTYEKNLISSIKHKDIKAGTEVEVAQYNYDSNNNPKSINVYFPERYTYDENGNKTIQKAGFYPIFQAEYYTDKKNFFGNTLDNLIPQLAWVKINNAFKKMTLPTILCAADISYTNYNEGGYPLNASYSGSSLATPNVPIYQGVLTFEYIK